MSEPLHIVVRINEKATVRVLNSMVGMTFIVDHFTDTVDNRGRIAHVRDYRSLPNERYHIWSIGPEGYEIV